MATGLRYLKLMLCVFTAIMISFSLCGCGGGGGEGSLAVAPPIVGDTGGSIAGTSRSASFGAHWQIPTQLSREADPVGSSATRYSWLSPYPDGGHTSQYSQLKNCVDMLAMSYSPTMTSTTNIYSSPLSVETCEANNWILHDDAGNPVKYKFSDTTFLCDPAAPGYAEAWATAAIARAKQTGCNFIWIDSMTNTHMSWFGAPGTLPSKYQPISGNDCIRWNAAAYHWLSIVSEMAHAEGLKLAMNFVNSRWGHEQIAPFVELVDAVMNEYAFVGSDGSTYDTWAAWRSVKDVVNLIEDTQATDKIALLLTRAMHGDPDYDRKVRFALAAYMIARKDGDVFILQDRPSSTSNTTRIGWHSDFPFAQSFGEARSEPTSEEGVWFRRYRNGIVLLNPTTQSLTVPEAARINRSVPSSIPARTGMLIPTSGT